jgi:hypothetical protein
MSTLKVNLQEIGIGMEPIIHGEELPAEATPGEDVFA